MMKSMIESLFNYYKNEIGIIQWRIYRKIDL